MWLYASFPPAQNILVLRVKPGYVFEQYHLFSQVASSVAASFHFTNTSVLARYFPLRITRLCRIASGWGRMPELSEPDGRSREIGEIRSSFSLRRLTWKLHGFVIRQATPAYMQQDQFAPTSSGGRKITEQALSELRKATVDWQYGWSFRNTCRLPRTRLHIVAQFF